MVRKLRSPTRTITRKGGKDFQGEFLSPKGPTNESLVFDSVSALMCGVHLEHRREVVQLSFELTRSRYVDVDGSEVEAIHDYHTVLETGEVEHFEAKYSVASLSEKELAKLERLQRAMAREGKQIQLVFRETLEQNGYIQTVLLLRRFGQLSFPEQTTVAAMLRLGSFESATLDVWLKRAQRAGVATGLLFHLLYHQQLPLLYERLVATELLPCRG
jgi:hypothetical protein